MIQIFVCKTEEISIAWALTKFLEFLNQRDLQEHPLLSSLLPVLPWGYKESRERAQNGSEHMKPTPLSVC